MVKVLLDANSKWGELEKARIAKKGMWREFWETLAKY